MKFRVNFNFRPDSLSQMRLGQRLEAPVYGCRLCYTCRLPGRPCCRVMTWTRAEHRQPLASYLCVHLLLSVVAGQERCANFTQPKFMSALPGSATGEQSLLTPDQQVTVILLNWMRQDNVRLIVEALENYTAVSEVLVLMCNPETRFPIHTSKAKALDFSALETTWGLTGRFKACMLARNPWVLVMDDDLLVTEAGLERLLQAKAQAPDRLVGFFARYAAA